MSTNRKKIPKTIGIFGASGHIGGPMASWLRYHAPQVRLRLITSRKDGIAGLRARFPGCDVTVGDYRDPASLVRAVADMEGLFVITTSGTDEAEAMGNLVSAIRQAGCLVHMIRTVGELPGANLRRIPDGLTAFRLGIETQHPIARRIIDESDLPNTYFNIGASFMDNLLRPGFFDPRQRKIVSVEHRVPYIDTREIGEAAARVLLDPDHRHLYQFHTLNNGQDYLFYRDVAQTMSDVLMTRIGFDDSEEGFAAAYGPLVAQGILPELILDFLPMYHRYEEENQVGWSLNDFLERTLGRTPTTLRSWLMEHRELFEQRLRMAA
ncbi:MAG: hypothetical protein EPO08_07285 [Rhodospirillaceae bacterium]|nr:MAG: hypothetical protein EPO08_07285 [Rhodospirillaceae bacterium]